MLKSVGFVGVSFLVLALAGCNPTEPVTAPPVAEVPAEPPPPPKPVRIAQTPLPSSEAVAQDLVKAIADEKKGQFFPAKVADNFPGGVRMAPESKSTLFPPTNAVAITITADLEPDAWIHHAEYNTDGIAIIVDAIGADGVSIARQELVVDPAVGTQDDAPVALSAPIPPEADHLEITFSGRANTALDNTTVIFAYN
jgi:hypothetical protein